MITATIKEIKESYKHIPYFAQIGAYPLVYITERGRAICPECAQKLEDEDFVAYDVLWENPEELCCDECGKELDAAYETEAEDK